MTAPRVVWAPNPGSQLAFLTCPAWEVLLHGTRGGGKSDVLLMDFAQHVGQGFGRSWRGVLFRKTYKQLADLVSRSLKWFPLIFPLAKFNESSLTWKFPDGEELLLRYLAKESDYLKYHGWELPWIGFDELTSHATRLAYEKMKTCSRSSFPGMPRKIRATTNPLGPGHNWVKHDFIDKASSGELFGEPGQRKCHIFSSIEENRQLMENDPEYIKKLEAITDENLKKAWRYGSWDVVSGGMFDDVWDRDIHVLSPFRIPSSWYIDRSFDWGSSRPFSVGWWAESDGTEVKIDGVSRSFPRGTLIRIGEWYGWNGQPNEGVRMLASEIARGIIERERMLGYKVRPGPADTSIYDIMNATSIAADMELAGVAWTRADKSPGSRKQGWQKIRSMLKAGLSVKEGRPMEEPGIFVFETCRQFQRTVPVLPRDERDADDVDSDTEDHIGDEVRYRATTVRRQLTVTKLVGT